MPENYFGNMVWWIGVVEDRISDPLELGRVKCRIVGYHSQNKNEMPTNDLPWCYVMQPITSAAMNGIGTTPTGMVEGTHVIGFFQDGVNAQEPVIMGTIGGIPQKTSSPQSGFVDPKSIYPKLDFLNESDTNRLAKNKKKFDDNLFEDLEFTEILETILTNRENKKGVELARGKTFASLNDLTDSTVEGIINTIRDIRTELGKLLNDLPEGITSDDITNAQQELVNLSNEFTDLSATGRGGILIEDLTDVFKDKAGNIIDSIANPDIGGIDLRSIDFSSLGLGGVDDLIGDFSFETVMNDIQTIVTQSIETVVDSILPDFQDTILKTFTDTEAFTDIFGDSFDFSVDGLSGAISEVVNIDLNTVFDGGFSNLLSGGIPVPGMGCNKKTSIDVPDSEAAPKYPFNHVRETESGHVKEYDDTEGKERIHEAHKTGTFYEIFPDGKKVTQVVNDNYLVVLEDDNVVIDGSCNVVIGSNASVVVEGCNLDIQIDKGNINILLKKGDVALDVLKGDVKMKVIKGDVSAMITKGDLSATCGGKIDLKSVGDIKLNSGGSIDLNAASKIDIIAGGKVSIDGAIIDIAGGSGVVSSTANSAVDRFGASTAVSGASQNVEGVDF